MTADIVESLGAATTALDRGDRPAALGHLLDAWRAVRHPRIANLVDFVSDQLTANARPFKGKSLATKLEAWQAVAATRDPAELGRLLRQPWPGSWQKALPMLQALLKFADDPRLAMHFARTVDATQYVTWTSDRFYGPLFARLDQLLDVRALPLLEAQLAKQKPRYYAADMRKLEERAVAKLHETYPDGPPPLAPDIEAALATLEARYAERIASSADKSRGEAEYVAAIHADPDDMAARAVYADWLQEHGDPRGEFITLQLARAAGQASDEAASRERKLLEQHGRQWAGAVGDLFEADDRVFEGGFFAGGVLRRLDLDLDRVMADPAWRLVRVLAFAYHHDAAEIEQILDRPELRDLRAVYGLPDEVGSRILTGPPRGWSEVSLTDRRGDSNHATHPVAHCRGLPRLRVLAISWLDEAVAGMVREAPVLDRIERLYLIAHGSPHRLLDAIASHDGTLREVELLSNWGNSPDRAEGWHARLTRTKAPGPFTLVRVTHRPSKRNQSWRFASDLRAILEAIPPAWPRELVVDAGRKLTLKAEDRTRLAETISQLTNLERLDVPWESPPPVTASEPERGREVIIRLTGDGLLDPDIVEAAWRCATERFGQRYDTFEVGYGSALRELGTAPLARIKKWSSNARVEALTLVRDGSSARFRLARRRRGHYDAITMLELTTEWTAAELVPRLVELLDLAMVEHGEVATPSVPGGYERFDLRDYEMPCAGWMIVVGEAVRAVLPLDEVQALASRPGLAGLVAAHSQRNLVIAGAATAEEMTAERYAAFVAGIESILRRHVPRKMGYDFPAVFRACMAPLLDERRMTPHRVTPIELEYRNAAGERIEARIQRPISHPLLYVALYVPEGDRTSYHSLLGEGVFSVAVDGAAQLTEVLTGAAAYAGYGLDRERRRR